MNAPEKIAFLPDIQSELDGRGLSIDAVGIKDIRYPIKVRSGERVVSTSRDVFDGGGLVGHH